MQIHFETWPEDTRTNLFLVSQGAHGSGPPPPLSRQRPSRAPPLPAGSPAGDSRSPGAVASLSRGLAPCRPGGGNETATQTSLNVCFIVTLGDGALPGARRHSARPPAGPRTVARLQVVERVPGDLEVLFPNMCSLLLPLTVRTGAVC